MDISKIKEDMKVVASDGQHIGTVDCVKDEQVILTKSDPASGGKHHAIPLDWVSSVEENKVRLNQTSGQARTNWVDAENQDGQSGSKAVCQ
jgi:hypothetical protein